MFLLLLLALLPGSALWQGSADEIGVVGYVLGPDGMPVSSGTVVIQSINGPATTPIEPNGRFRFVPARSGPLRVTVSVAGLAPYTFRLTVPASRAIRLPVIRLDPATYFRVRFVTPEGETITTPQLRRQSFDANGALIDDIPGGDGVSQQIDGTGATIIGPLPRGITALALDMPFYAQTRLPNVVVNGADELIDGGTVTVQPGAVLQIDLVDETGAAVPDLPISLEDTRPLSPLPISSSEPTSRGGRRSSGSPRGGTSCGLPRSGNATVATSSSRAPLPCRLLARTKRGSSSAARRRSGSHRRRWER